MADLSDFEKNIRRIAVSVEEGTGRVVRQCALAVDQTVVMATPVDTGRARSNWIAQLNAPARETIDPYFPGEAGSTGGANTQAAIDQASAVIAGYSVDDNPTIFISNNLPYIGPLNAGWSSQAPAQYVEMAVQAGTAAVQGARILED